MALFRRRTEAAPEPEPTPSAPTVGPARKDRPTPTRKEAEALRRQRVGKNLNSKEARKEANRKARADRVRVMNEREAAPEKQLLRDYIDSRFNIGEFVLPALVVILALTFLNSVFPFVTYITTVLMYLFLLVAVIDVFLMWRGFKKVLADRMPRTPTRGLLMYGMNRCIQIRRFRIPPPRLKRGEKY
ncbi:DUF3043 domain-containing protein [Microlunatus speluncae]|uniref:DUF3043 domain-containing protein n=1 Tax=Microlunatus speluncae TaxID=2594267 RepID=UPI0012666CEF|nr:DUF3043 domain-containing protein [Microlunatus speluncae]